MSKLIGNADQREGLRRALARDAHHAFILYGEEQLGKRTVVLEVIQEELGISTTRAHPDFHYIQSDKEKAAPTIGIDAIREARRFLSLRPFAGTYKALVINDAHLMTTAAANALLKSLEEPPEASRIFLITSQIGSLLPTVRSRALQLRFLRVSDDTLQDVFAGTQVEADEKQEITSLAHGRVGLALDLLGDVQAREALARRVSALHQLLDAPTITRLAYAAKAQAASPEAMVELPLQWLPALEKPLREGNVQARHLVDALFSTIEAMRAGTLRPELLLESALLSY